MKEFRWDVNCVSFYSNKIQFSVMHCNPSTLHDVDVYKISNLQLSIIGNEMLIRSVRHEVPMGCVLERFYNLGCRFFIRTCVLCVMGAMALSMINYNHYLYFFQVGRWEGRFQRTLELSM